MSVASPEHTSRELEEHLERLQLDGPVGDDELERFRNEWRAEVKSRKPAGVSSGAATTTQHKLSDDVVNPVLATQTASSGPAFTSPTSPKVTPASSSSAKPNGKGKDADVTQGTTRKKGAGATSPRVGSADLPKTQASSITSPARSNRSLSPATSPRAIRSRPLLVAEEDAEGPLELHAAGTSSFAGPSRSPERPRTVRPPGGRPAGKAKGDAVSIYARAVEAEQAGQLNNALNLYRQAFKMDDNVDRLYAHHRSKIKLEPITPTSTDLVSADPPTNAPYTFQRTIQTAPDYDPHHAHVHAHADGAVSHLHASTSARQSPLTALLRRADPDPSSRPFSPADEALPVPIDSLPSEVFEHVLHHLDVAGIESFGSTCWRARWLTAHSEEWKRRAERIYSRPAVNPDEMGLVDMGRRYGGEWRTVLVEKERVRMDGCYIAVCHYIRPGAGDEWVTITHMITYHRFLRFYPDGTVLSFLTTDHPSEVVPLLKPTLRAKGLHIGTYTLAPTDNGPNAGAPDAIAPPRPNRRIIVSELLEPGNPAPKYEFEMELSLRETSRGRWNKLDITSYQSVNLATGEVLALALKHQKPFYFSKVRSYQPAL